MWGWGKHGAMPRCHTQSGWEASAAEGSGVRATGHNPWMSLHVNARNIKHWPHEAHESDPDPGAAAIRLVETLLEPYPGLTIERQSGQVTVVVTADGFDVRIVDDGPEATVGMAGWHGHYGSPTEASKVFMKLLSEDARVILTSRGRRCTSGVVEFARDGGWVEFERCMLVFGWLIPGRKRREIFQNQLI